MSLPEHKAAGILPLRLNAQTHNVEALLAWEEVYGTRRCRYFDHPRGCRQGDACEYIHIRGDPTPNESEATRLNFLGGKRDSELETPQETAARELYEETHHFVTLEQAKAIVEDSRSVTMRLAGCYDLYIGWLDSTAAERVVEEYRILGRNDPYACAEELLWVPLTILLNVQENDLLGYFISFEDDHNDDDEIRAPRPVSHLLRSFCINKKAKLEAFLIPELGPKEETVQELV